MEAMSTEPSAQPKSKRVIKRYSNRKLYDTKDSRYVTLGQIAEMVRSGEDVQVLDNASREDKTEATLALILSEEVKSQPKQPALSGLKDRLISQLRESPLGRLMGDKDDEAAPISGDQAKGAAPRGPERPAAEPPPATEGQAAPAPRNRLQQTLDEWQAAMDERMKQLDERVKSLFPGASGKTEPKAQAAGGADDLRRLAQRVADLEKRLALLEKRASRE